MHQCICDHMLNKVTPIMYIKPMTIIGNLSFGLIRVVTVFVKPHISSCKYTQMMKFYEAFGSI